MHCMLEEELNEEKSLLARLEHSQLSCPPVSGCQKLEVNGQDPYRTHQYNLCGESIDLNPVTGAPGAIDITARGRHYR